MSDNRRRRVLVYGTAVLILLPAATGAGFLPRVANHFGYALPWPDGLPYSVHYRDRDYHSPRTCAGAGWCDGPGPVCLPHPGRLVRVDDVFTYFGTSHDVFVDGSIPPRETPIGVLVEAHDGCYVAYSLSGGL